MFGLQIGREADLIQIQDAVAHNVILVPVQNFLHHGLQGVGGDGQVHILEHTAHVHVQLRQVTQIQREAVRIQQTGQVKGTAAQIKCTAQIKVQGAGVELEGILQGVGVHREQGFHIKSGTVVCTEFLSGEDIGLRVGHLLLHDGAGLGLLDDVFGQGMSVADAGGQHGGRRICVGLHDAHNGQVSAVGNGLLHIVGILRLVPPQMVRFIVDVTVSAVEELEALAEKILVGVGLEVIGDGDVLVLGELLDHLVQFGVVPQAHGVQGIIRDAAAGIQHQHAFVVGFRPAAGLDVVLGCIQLRGLGQFREHTGVHHGGHDVVGRGLGADAQRGQGRVRIHLPDASVSVLPVDLGCYIVGVLNGGGVVCDRAVGTFQVGLEGLQVVGSDAGDHLRNELAYRNHAFFAGRSGGTGSGCIAAGQHGSEVHAAAHDLQGVLRQGRTFHVRDVVVDTGGQGNDECDADDADGSGKSREQSTGFFGAQVVEAQRQRGEHRHGRAAHVLVHRRRDGCSIRLIGHGVGADDAVLQVDDAGRIALGQLRVVGDHDHQPVFGDLFQQLHDLDAGLAVQSAGRFVGQQDVRVVHQGAGDGHALHLTAGHFAGVLVQLVAQADLFQRFGGAAFALGTGDAGDGQSQLHVGQHGLVRDQIVALEHKADGVVAVGIPIAIGVFPRGNTVDDQVAAVVAVQTADDVQQGGLAGTAGAEDGDKFAVAQVQTDIVQRVLYKVAGFILFADVFDLQHSMPFRIRSAEGCGDDRAHPGRTGRNQGRPGRK